MGTKIINGALSIYGDLNVLGTNPDLPYASKITLGSGMGSVESSGSGTLGIIAGNNLTLKSNHIYISDKSSSPKQAELLLSNITSGAIRKLTIQDKDGTIATTDDIAQVLDLGTISFNSSGEAETSEPLVVALFDALSVSGSPVLVKFSTSRWTGSISDFSMPASFAYSQSLFIRYLYGNVRVSTSADTGFQISIYHKGGSTSNTLTIKATQIPLDSGLVHKTGDEAISGTKTFQDWVTIESQYVSYPKLRLENEKIIVWPTSTGYWAGFGYESNSTQPTIFINNDTSEGGYRITIPYKDGTIATTDDCGTKLYNHSIGFDYDGTGEVSRRFDVVMLTSTPLTPSTFDANRKYIISILSSVNSGKALYFFKDNNNKWNIRQQDDNYKDLMDSCLGDIIDDIVTPL